METVSRYVYPVDLTSEIKIIDEICRKMKFSKAEAIREALSHYYEYVRGIKVIEIRTPNSKDAEKEILSYLKSHKKAFTSQIADELQLDLLQVNGILVKLAEEGKVK
ncbi:ribbon-helix-helix protein, CopG family [Candidatus Micrarchaeota archaeon]|nr:ribbon-helix-helix protein, CopG family [Candidatus Micrarchaeota archaeon]